MKFTVEIMTTWEAIRPFITDEELKKEWQNEKAYQNIDFSDDTTIQFFLDEFVKSDAIMEIEQNVIDSIKFHEIDKKYNIDAIIIAFRNGFRNYCNNYFIAYNYEIIGKTFYIPYDVV